MGFQVLMIKNLLYPFLYNSFCTNVGLRKIDILLDAVSETTKIKQDPGYTEQREFNEIF